MLRDLNTKYGAKFVLNIYYTAADDAKFPTPGGFTLPQFPDRYQGEFRDNCALAEAGLPRPLEYAEPAVSGRPAGKAHRRHEAWWTPKSAVLPARRRTPLTTCIHFGMMRPSAFKPLYEYGVRVLSSRLLCRNGKWDVNCELPDDVSAYVASHDAWKDFESGLVFSMVDIVCNSVPVDRIAGVEPLAKDPNKAEIMDLFTHEQYFWPFYMNYIPDHPKRIETAIRWVTERGYKPVFFHEGFLGGRQMTG